MKPASFDYFAPTSVEQTCALLARYGDDAKILAGGQSLVPLLDLRLAQPAVLIDINGVRELDYIQASSDGLSIGVGTRHRTVERSSVVREQFPLLSAGIEWIGHPQIRNRGTVGGSLAHADPAAELPALVLALDATFTVVIEHLEKPPISPVNFRGVGEGGAICAPPAIVNTISDALGKKITEQSLPPTRVLERMGAIPEEKWGNKDKEKNDSYLEKSFERSTYREGPSV